VASVTTVSAFVPMLILDGTEGEYAFSMGGVVALVLLGSWLSAMYILPALCAWFIKPKRQAQDRLERPGIFVRIYARILQYALPLSVIVLVGSYALVMVSATVFMPKLKSEMFPLSDRDQYLVYMDMPKGTSLARTERSALQINRWLLDSSANPEVLNTSLYVGEGGPRFFLSLNPVDNDPASAFFLVNTRTFEGAVVAAKRAQRYLLEQHPEARFKIKRLAMGGSESGIVEIKISGPDGNKLLELARQMESKFAVVPGIVQNENDWGNKVVKVVVNIAQDKARELGVTSQSISEVLDGYFSGSNISTFREGDKSFPIAVRAQEAFRDNLDDISSLSITTNGNLISLDQVATFRPQLEFSRVQRENQQRQIKVSAKSGQLSAEELLESVQPALESLQLPDGYTVNIDGETARSGEVYGKLSAGIPIALSVMLIALIAQFNSVRRVALTFMTIPLVLIGAPIALWLTGRPLSFFAVLGMISLAGIIINNAIVLIDQVDLERQRLRLKPAIIAAASKRFTPIMLTSLTTVFGLLPMAISGGVLWEPMATLMIGGLVVASVLTLLFVPTVYYLLFRSRAGCS